MSPQVTAASSESESEADSEAAPVQSPKQRIFGAVIVGNVKSGKYHRADEDHPELVLPACHAGKYIMNV